MTRRGVCRVCVALSSLTLSFSSGSTVFAAEIAERAFDIRGLPLNDALVAIASDAGVSLDLTHLAMCGRPTVWLRTRTGLADAFAIALAGTPCRVQQIAPGVYRVIQRRTGAAAASDAAAPAAVGDRAVVTDVAELSVLAPRRLPVSTALASAASVVSGPVLLGQGIHDTSDLALLTPSLTVTNLGLGRDKIFVRGLSDGPLTGQAQSMVGLYLDDVRLTFSAPDPNLRIIDMAEVDVLRGPQGALFGAGSLGGVVQMVSKRPDHTAFVLESRGSVSETDHGAPSQAFDGVLNLPTADGRGAVRLVAYEDFQGGYLENTILHHSATNQTLRRGVRATADYDIFSTFRTTAGAVIQGINSSDSQYKSADAPDYTRTNAINEPHDNDFAAYHVGLDGDLAAIHLNWAVATVQHSLFSRYDATIAPPVDLAGVPAVFDDRATTHDTTSDLTVRSAGQAVDWIAGVFLANGTETRSMSLTALATGSARTLALDSRVHRTERAVYGQGTIGLGFGLKLTLGGRIFDYTSHYDSAGTIAGDTASSRFTGTVRQAGFAPKAMLEFSPAAEWRTYLLASEGYRGAGDNAATLPVQGTPIAGADTPRRTYAGDELWNFEVGARYVGADGRLVAHVAAFEALWRKIQSDQLLPNGLPFTTNIGDGRNVGLEGEATYQSGALSLGAEALLNGPELISTSGGYQGRADTGLSVAPDVSGAVYGSYSWRIGRATRLQLNGRVAYVGTSSLALSGAAAPTMGGYATARASAVLDTGRWQVSLVLDNPAGTVGNTFAYGNPFSSRATQQTTPLRPATLTLSLATAF